MLLPVPPGKWTAEGFAELFLERYVSVHWLPQAITSDRGTQFVNAFWAKLCELLKIERRLSTSYHPETDGSTERRNQEVETYLRSFVAYHQGNWDSLCPIAQIALDNRPTTTTGVSPFFLVHGYDPTIISVTSDTTYRAEERGPPRNPQQRGELVFQKLRNAQDFAHSALASAQQRQESYANRSRDTPLSFQVGDKVWLNLKNIATDRPSKKLDWIHAKYTIQRTFENAPHFYELDMPKGIHKKFHVSLLRPAVQDPLPSQEIQDTQPPAILTSEGNEEYGLEEILCCQDKRIGNNTRREALVKWVGYARPSWEPLIDLQDTVALDIFEERYGNALHNNGPLEQYCRRRRGQQRQPT